MCFFSNNYLRNILQVSSITIGVNDIDKMSIIWAQSGRIVDEVVVEWVRHVLVKQWG